MAEADRKVRITIETKGDGSGAHAVAKSLDAVATAERGIESTSDAFRELDSVMKKTAATSSQVLQSQSLLVAKHNAATEAIKRQNAQNAVGAKGLRNVGSMAQQAGYQIGDFAVQVGGGQNAMVAFAQQGSQLLGLLGPGGALAGALLAIGAAMYNAFQKGGDSAEKAKEKAMALTEALMETAKALGQEDFQRFSDTLGEMGEQSLLLYDATVDQNDALRDQAKAQKAIEAGWRKAAGAAFEYLEATDPNFDASKAKSGLESDQRAASRDAAVQAQLDKAQQAREIYNKIFAEQAVLQEKEAILLARRSELEAQAAPLSRKAAAFEDIQQRNKSSALQPEINQIRAELDRINEDLAGVNQELNQEVERELGKLKTRAVASGNALQKVINETTTEIEQINQGFNAEESAAKAKEATEKVKQGAAALQTFVADFQAITPVQQQAEANIAAAIADGKLTADELLTVTNSLKVLQGSLRSGQEGQNQNIQSLIVLTTAALEETKRQKAFIEGVAQRFGIPIK